MITLTTILNLSPRDQQKFLREVDNDELALALQCDDNDMLAESLASNMSKRCAEEFREQLKKARASVEEAESDGEEQELPAPVATAREKMFSVVTRLAENGDITIPEVIIPRVSKWFDERMESAKNRIRECICAVQENRAVLRKHILEEAANQGEDMAKLVTDKLCNYGTDSHLEDVEIEFERELNALISGFLKKHIISGAGESAHDALIVLGGEGRRQIKARLLSEHYDTLLSAVAENTLAFEDLVLLGDRDIQKVLREVEQGVLARALKGASYNVCEKIYRNMSNRAATMLREDIEFMGAVKKSHIYEAQDAVIAIITRMEEAGDIVIGRTSDEVVE